MWSTDCSCLLNGTTFYVCAFIGRTILGWQYIWQYVAILLCNSACFYLGHRFTSQPGYKRLWGHKDERLSDQHRFGFKFDLFFPIGAGPNNCLRAVIQLPWKQTAICPSHHKNTNQITKDTGCNENLSAKPVINRLTISAILFNDSPYNDPLPHTRIDIMADDDSPW